MKGKKTWLNYSFKDSYCDNSCNTNKPLASKFKSLPVHSFSKAYVTYHIVSQIIKCIFFTIRYYLLLLLIPSKEIYGLITAYNFIIE